MSVFPSHRQLNKAALFIFIYDKDLSSGCTFCMLKKSYAYLFPSLYAVLKICDQCHEKMVIIALAIFSSHSCNHTNRDKDKVFLCPIRYDLGCISLK